MRKNKSFVIIRSAVRLRAGAPVFPNNFCISVVLKTPVSANYVIGVWKNYVRSMYGDRSYQFRYTTTCAYKFELLNKGDKL